MSSYSFGKLLCVEGKGRIQTERGGKLSMPKKYRGGEELKCREISQDSASGNSTYFSLGDSPMPSDRHGRVIEPANGGGGEVGGGGVAEFVFDMLTVGFDGFDAHAEFGGDRRDGQAFADEGEYLELPGGEMGAGGGFHAGCPVGHEGLGQTFAEIVAAGQNRAGRFHHVGD